MADKGYTTEAKINSYLNTTITTGSANNYILAVQKFIENYTGRNFKADTTASARLFNGNDKDIIMIDECVAISKVEIGNDSWGDNFTEILSTGDSRYYPLPTNYGSLEIPINSIGLRANTFYSGFANQRITAKWGFSVNVPDDISLVATILTSIMYNTNKNQKSGAVSRKKLGNFEVTFEEGENGYNEYQQAIQILNNYKLLTI